MPKLASERLTLLNKRYDKAFLIEKRSISR
jgi:hypothetical protein